MWFDISDEAFRSEGAAWLQSLGTDTISDLQTVFRLSPGYYPTTLAELWRAELARRGLPEVPTSMTSTVSRHALPVCHPGDYEWRFTSKTAAMLLENLIQDLPVGARIAHLGTPTTFMLGLDRYGGFRHFLLDRNAPTVDAPTSAENVCCIDLLTELPPELDAQAAIADPPWYPTDTRAFLVATSRVCAVGARIVLCQPTRATRPGVTEERAALLDQLPQLGFVCRGVDAACVRYRMPYFEASSLKVVAPELMVPDDWRTGDLLTLEKISDTVSQLPSIPVSECWQEATFGPVRIKLRRTSGPDIGSLVPGDILRTVSRRDPIRQHIGMWTSSNRVYRLDHPREIGSLIESCHTDVMRSQFTLGRTLDQARWLDVQRRVARRLFDVLLIELQEHSLRGGSVGSHE